MRHIRMDDQRKKKHPDPTPPQKEMNRCLEYETYPNGWPKEKKNTLIQNPPQKKWIDV